MNPLQMREKLYRIMTWCTAVFAVLCCILCVVYFQNMDFFETHGKIGALAQQEQQALAQENSRRLLAKKNVSITISDQPEQMLVVPLHKAIDQSGLGIREEFLQNKLIITIKEGADCISDGAELISDSVYMSGISVYQQKNDMVLELYCNDIYGYEYEINDNALKISFMDRSAAYKKTAVIYMPQEEKDSFSSEEWQNKIKAAALENQCKLYLCSELQEDYTQEQVVDFANRIRADYLLAVKVKENAENSQLRVICNPVYFIPEFGSVDLGMMLAEAVKTKTSLPIVAVDACQKDDFLVEEARMPAAMIEISLSGGYLKSIETEYSFYHAVMEALEATMTQIISTQMENDK